MNSKNKKPGNIQADINQDEFSASEHDPAYAPIFQALSQEPSKGFSLGFSANIIRTLEAKKDRKFLYLLYGLFAMILLGGFTFIGFYLNDTFLVLAKGTLTDKKWVLLFGSLMIFAIQLADKKFRPKNN